MNPKEGERLVNILARTGSNHDGEALAAVRKANELLRRHRLSWQEILKNAPGGPTIGAAPEPEQERPSQRRGRAEEGPENPAGWWHRPEPQRPPDWGRDIFGESPARRPKAISRWEMLAGRVRLFLAGVAWPLRVILGPLTVAAYCIAWLLESRDAGDVLGRIVATGVAVGAAGAAYGAFTVAVVRMIG